MVSPPQGGSTPNLLLLIIKHSMTTFSIAIISDPHVFDGVSGDDCPSFIATKDDQANPRQNPFAGLRNLIADQHLKCDYLFCGGDLGDRATPDAQQYAWQSINQIGGLLQVKEVFGAAGNHDVDSRFAYNQYDAKGQILSLEPKFPTSRESNWLEYWARNFTIVDLDEARLLLLNSSAFHGYHKSGETPEYIHGRVSDRTLDAIAQRLSGARKRSINILFCHHHPIKNDAVKNADYSHMDNGDRLVNLVQDLGVGPWMLLHGHKHAPRLYYAPGDSSAPTVFSAGSFAAKPFRETSDPIKPEFYIITIQNLPENSSSTVRGRIEVWQWSYGIGWGKGKQGIGLGNSAGFGARLDTSEFASEIGTRLKQMHSGTSLKWSDFTDEFPKLQHLIPSDLKRVIDQLRESYGVRCYQEADHYVQVDVPE